MLVLFYYVGSLCVGGCLVICRLLVVLCICLWYLFVFWLCGDDAFMCFSVDDFGLIYLLLWWKFLFIVICSCCLMFVCVDFCCFGCWLRVDCLMLWLMIAYFGDLLLIVWFVFCVVCVFCCLVGCLLYCVWLVWVWRWFDLYSAIGSCVYVVTFTFYLLFLVFCILCFGFLNCAYGCRCLRLQRLVDFWLFGVVRYLWSCVLFGF